FFYGDGDPKNPSIERWLKSIETYARENDWSDRHKLMLARRRVRGLAAQYLDQDTEVDDTESWEVFRTAMLRRCKADVPMDRRLAEYMECKQKEKERMI